MKRYFLALLGLLIIFESGVLLEPKLKTLFASLKSNQSLEDLASDVLEKCRSEPSVRECYDEEIPKLMDKISMEDTFRVVKFVQEKDKNYFYCHVLGHELAAKETKKDPGNWKEVIARCPSGMCSNGCIHGAFQERFRTEVLTDSEIEELKKDLAEICEEKKNWRPTGMEQATCYHALGHLLMYITGADIVKSSKICREIAVKEEGREFLNVCFDGAFMQIFQPLEPEDFELVEGLAPKKEGLFSYCSKFANVERNSCWREGWPLFFPEIMTSAGMTNFCSKASNRNHCFKSMFYMYTSQVNFDQEKIVNLCSNLSEPVAGLCFANAASRIIETDWTLLPRSLALCREAEGRGVSDECYKELTLYATFNFHPGSEESLKVCDSLPEKWKNDCRNKSLRLKL